MDNKSMTNQVKIEDLIGEATEYDKKQAVETKKPKSWCKSVSAFANTSGGIYRPKEAGDERQEY